MTEKSVSLLGKIAGFTEILAKDPQSTVFVSLSEAYRQLGMLDDALEIAEKGTRRLPAFSPGFVALGRILAQQGDLGRAGNAFEQALGIEKDSLQALKGLARTRYRQGYLDQARELLLRAEELNPQDPVVQKMLSSLHGQGPVVSFEPVSTAVAEPLEQAAGGGGSLDATAASNPPAAEPETAVDLQPITSDADADEATSARGDERGAAEAMQTVTMAQLYFRQGLYEDAAGIYREILRKEPHNEEIRARLVEIRSLQAPVADDEANTSIAEPAPVAPALELAAAPNSEPVDIFQRWLSAIEQRRAHVC